MKTTIEIQCMQIRLLVSMCNAITSKRNTRSYSCMYTCTHVHMYVVGMGDYENRSQRLLSVQVLRLLRLLATLHIYM